MSPTSTSEAATRAARTRKDTAIRTAMNFRLLFTREKEISKGKMTDAKTIKMVQKIFYDRDEISGHPKYISNQTTKRTSTKMYSSITIKSWLRGELLTKDGVVKLGPNLLTPKKSNNVTPITIGIQEITRLHNEVQIVKQRLESLIQLLMRVGGPDIFHPLQELIEEWNIEDHKGDA